MRRRLGVGLLALLVVVACGEPEEAPSPGVDGGDAPTANGNFTGGVYERNFVFAAVEDDSVFMVPWLIRSEQEPDSMLREARGWLARGGVWDAFYTERWRTRATRAPARVLPHEGLRLLVREGDAIDGILFERGRRSLEIILDDVRESWTGPRGGSFEVLTGAAYLADQRVDGMVLDMARAAGGSVGTGGDWAFLLSGDSAQFVFAADSEHGGEDEPSYRGWASLPDEALLWPELRVDWARTEAFPPARRDVPVEWRISSSDGLVEGNLEASSAEMQAGDGPGPLLPVLALFEVAGSISTVDGDFDVRGIFVHERR